MRRWRYVLLPFHSRIRLINTFLIFYITFFSPFLCLSQRSSKTFLQALKDFLWRNKPREGKPWHWGKWEGVATPRHMGGFSIINPIQHTMALYAKLFITLASSSQGQAVMARDMVKCNKLYSAGEEWKGMNVESKLLRPKGTRLKIGGHVGSLITKCMVSAENLIWNENPRYYKNSTLH